MFGAQRCASIVFTHTLMRWDGFGFENIELSRVIDAPFTPLMEMRSSITSAPVKYVIGDILPNREPGTVMMAHQLPI